MKKLLIGSLLTLSLGSKAIASSNKICFGSTKSEETKGVVILATIDNQKVLLNTTKTIYGQAFGNDYYGGKTYPSRNSTVKGRDGKLYLEYNGENSDYQDIIMVDSELLKNGTTGLLQIRARGEGFFNSVFVCKDSK